MITIIVNVDVKEKDIESFITETKISRLQTLDEPGCLDYQIYQDTTDLTKFKLVESYTSHDAIASHSKTNHFLTWRTNVQDMMNTPRTNTKNTLID